MVVSKQNTAKENIPIRVRHLKAQRLIGAVPLTKLVPLSMGGRCGMEAISEVLEDGRTKVKVMDGSINLNTI